MISTIEASNEERPSAEELAALGEAIAETAAFLDAATHRFLTQLRAFDRARGWERSGALSCAVDPIAWLRTSLADGAAISPATNEPEWDGQRINLDLCIAALSLAGDERAMPA